LISGLISVPINVVTFADPPKAALPAAIPKVCGAGTVGRAISVPAEVTDAISTIIASGAAEAEAEAEAEVVVVRVGVVAAAVAVSPREVVSLRVRWDRRSDPMGIPSSPTATLKFLKRGLASFDRRRGILLPSRPTSF